MEGVILFADDHINTDNSGEKALFESLCKLYPVLGVERLEHAEKALLSMSGFQAVILDWDFNSNNDNSSLDVSDEYKDEKVKISTPATKENATMDFLRRNDFYTLIYIFSNIGESLKTSFPSELLEKFNDRIQFVQKGDLSDTNAIHQKIVTDISDWQKTNTNLLLPIKWSSSINQSLQQIFSELASADINWILNLYETANSDGVNPEIEVISLLQNILTEKLIANPTLLSEVKTSATTAKSSTAVLANSNSIAKLFQRIYYTDLTSFSIDNVPIMTGDVFLLEPDKKIYGIIISPECDVRNICNTDLYFEFLTFKESDFNWGNFSSLFGKKNARVQINNNDVVKKIRSSIKRNFRTFSNANKPPVLYKKGKVKTFIVDDVGSTIIQSEKGYNPIEEDVLIKLFLSQFEILLNKNIGPDLQSKIRLQIDAYNSSLLNDLLLQAYNQTEKRIHLIPSFKFSSEFPNKTAVIDFRTGKVFKNYAELKVDGVQRICKLNQPFISELRQRYNAYYGRVGVPKIPTILRKYNIESLQLE